MGKGDHVKTHEYLCRKTSAPFHPLKPSLRFKPHLTPRSSRVPTSSVQVSKQALVHSVSRRCGRRAPISRRVLRSEPRPRPDEKALSRECGHRTIGRLDDNCPFESLKTLSNLPEEPAGSLLTQQIRRDTWICRGPRLVPVVRDRTGRSELPAIGDDSVYEKAREDTARRARIHGRV
jgi:hypothetical protein